MLTKNIKKSNVKYCQLQKFKKSLKAEDRNKEKRHKNFGF